MEVKLEVLAEKQRREAAARILKKRTSERMEKAEKRTSLQLPSCVGTNTRFNFVNQHIDIISNFPPFSFNKTSSTLSTTPSNKSLPIKRSSGQSEVISAENVSRICEISHETPTKQAKVCRISAYSDEEDEAGDDFPHAVSVEHDYDFGNDERERALSSNGNALEDARTGRRGRKMKFPLGSSYEVYSKTDIVFFLSMVSANESLWFGGDGSYHD